MVYNTLQTLSQLPNKRGLLHEQRINSLKTFNKCGSYSGCDGANVSGVDMPNSGCDGANDRVISAHNSHSMHTF